MLTFFRRIRKRLFAGGSTSKYILYAIGEIALVVVGILIALQINNWNEGMKDRVQEKEILHSLIDNFELNIETLESDVERLYLYNQSSQIVLAVLDKRLPYSDSLAVHFHRARLPKMELSLSQSGYEQYKNAGFNIILNDKSKHEVIHYFESTFPNWFTSYNQVNAISVPFVDYHVPLFIYKGGKIEPVDMEVLYSDLYLLGWLRAYMGGRKTLIEMETNLIDETNKVLQLIKDELGDQ